MRDAFIYGNWKMNKTISESLEFIQKLREEKKVDYISNVKIVLSPSFLALQPVQQACYGSIIKMGAQNAFYEQQGAYNGEISPKMLKEVCEYVLLGHSERRTLFGDTDEMINKRVLASLDMGLKPILSIGESSAEFEAGQTQEVLLRQLTKALKDVDKIDEIVILYEPVWALGTGQSLPPEEMNLIARYIREIAEKLFDAEQSEAVRIIYAGSINPTNAVSYIAQDEVDGLAIGTASLSVDDFYSIISKVSAFQSENK